MAADQMQLIVVTPQRQVLDTAARWVELPAESGQMRALPEHAPTLGVLGEGSVRFAPVTGGGEQAFTVQGGFFEVLGDKVTLLADSSSAGR
ncbi:MAG: F0F1 ATP synthase subunit epsilon [Terriglobales bacterium]